MGRCVSPLVVRELGRCLAAYSPFAKAKRDAEARLLAARSRLKRCRADCESVLVHYAGEFTFLQMELLKVLEDLRNLKDGYDEEYRQLDRDKLRLQRIRFLQTQYLSEAGIEGLGPERVATLASYGIETAYDIDEKELRQNVSLWYMPINALVAWRAAVEKTFPCDPGGGIPAADVRELMRRYLYLRKTLEEKLQDGLPQLKRMAAQADSVAKLHRPRLSEAEQDFAQAAADLAAVLGQSGRPQ